MASEPHDFREMIRCWPRLDREQRATLVRQLVARSRGGDPVTEQMIELLALLRETGTGEPGGTGHAPRADRGA